MSTPKGTHMCTGGPLWGLPCAHHPRGVVKKKPVGVGCDHDLGHFLLIRLVKCAPSTPRASIRASCDYEKIPPKFKSNAEGLDEHLLTTLSLLVHVVNR